MMFSVIPAKELIISWMILINNQICYFCEVCRILNTNESTIQKECKLDTYTFSVFGMLEPARKFVTLLLIFDILSIFCPSKMSSDDP